MKRRSIAILLAVLLVISMVGCGKTDDSAKGVKNGSKEKTIVKFFNGNVEMVDWYNEAVDRFNEQSDTIKVEHEFQKEGTAALQTKIAADDIPDITTMSTQQMVDAGKFLDLSGSEWWDRIDPSVKELSKDTKSGKNYYLPTNTMITAAIIFQGLFALGGILDINPDAVNDLRVSAMPAINADVKPTINRSPDSTYYIMADSPNEEAAKEFLTWLFDEKNQASYTETRNAPSAFTDVTADLGPIVKSAVEAAKDAASLGPVKEPAGFGGDATGVMLQEFFAGQYTPDEFAKEYEKAWKTAFDTQ